MLYSPPQTIEFSPLIEVPCGEGVIELKPIDIQGVELGPDDQAVVEITFTVNEQQLLFVEVKAPGVHEQRQMEF